MGKVFLALDQKTGKEVAVKKDQKQWDRERVILQKLKHTKGVPELFFAGKEKELFLVMEYISSIIAVSARDSILLKNSIHMNVHEYNFQPCIFNSKNHLYALKNTRHFIIIK